MHNSVHGAAHAAAHAPSLTAHVPRASRHAWVPQPFRRLRALHWQWPAWAMVGAATAGRAIPGGTDAPAWFEAAADLTEKNSDESLLISAKRLGAEASCLWHVCRQNGPLPSPVRDRRHNRGFGLDSGFVTEQMEGVFSKLGMVAPTRSGDLRVGSRARNKAHLNSQQYCGYTKAEVFEWFLQCIAQRLVRKMDSLMPPSKRRKR